MNEGFSRLLQRADCRKNAPHRNASSPTRTAAQHRCGAVSRFVFRPARRDKKPIQTGESPPIRMFRRRKNAPYRNAGRNPAKQPPVKSNQDGD